VSSPQPWITSPFSGSATPKNPPSTSAVRQGIEGQVGTGLGDDALTVNGTRITVKNKEFYGVYLRPYIQATDAIELYGRLGYFSGKLSASGQGVSESERKNDTAFGLGAAYSLNKSLAITLEYNQWFDNPQVRGSNS